MTFYFWEICPYTVNLFMAIHYTQSSGNPGNVHLQIYQISCKHSRCTFDRFMVIKPAVLVLLPLCSTVWATGTEIWCWSGYSLCARTEIQASVSMERFGPPHLHTDSDSLRRNVRPRSWQWSPSFMRQIIAAHWNTNTGSLNCIR